MALEQTDLDTITANLGEVATGAITEALKDFKVQQTDEAKALMEAQTKQVADLIEAAKGAAPVMQDEEIAKKDKWWLGRLMLCHANAELDRREGKQTTAAEYAESKGWTHMVEGIKSAAKITENRKALGADTAAGGGFIIPPEWSDQFIEELIPASVVLAAGAQVFPIQGSLPIPGMATGTTWSWTGENDALTESTPTFDEILLRENFGGTFVVMSNQLIRFSSGRAAQIIQTNLVRQAGAGIDLKFLLGDGTNDTPKGLREWSADQAATHVNASAGATLANTKSDANVALNALATANLPMARVKVFMHPGEYFALRALTETTGATAYPSLLVPGETQWGTYHGAPVYLSTQIPTNLGGSTNESYIMFVDIDGIIAGMGPQTVDARDGAPYENSSGTGKSGYIRNQTVARILASADLVDIYQGLSIATVSATNYAARP